ncbi:MAG: glycoside hydrolase family 71 protein [Steroidobacteraceae bacterium]
MQISVPRRAAIAWHCGLVAALGVTAGAFAASVSEQDPSRIGACLPFTMPDPGALFASPKKVFAHYFYPFPLQIDGRPASEDYYNRNHLNPNGESGRWAAKGGFLRQRPLAVGPSASAGTLQLNMEREVRMAIARGITGFTIDIMSVGTATAADGPLHRLLNAAHAVDPRFKIVVMPDISALKSDADAVTRIIAAAASSPAAYRLADGRLVVTAFAAGKNPPEWWESIFARLKSQGINVSFVPTFLGWKGNAKAFATISDGFGDWGTATAGASAGMKGDPALAHQTYGKLFMMPVDPQQYRPKDGIYWEAANSSTFRNAWMSAIDGGADWGQIVTWSDFSESSEIEPYTDSTLRGDIGTGFYDLNAFYATWFLLGKEPSITHDVLYFFYRREPTDAAARSQSPVKQVGDAPARNDIELLAFLTAPGTLTISIGDQRVTRDAPAGVTSFSVPTQPGTPVFSVTRNGSTVFSFQAPVQIFGPEGLPSGLIDMTYWSGSASKDGVCSL